MLQLGIISDTNYWENFETKQVSIDGEGIFPFNYDNNRWTNDEYISFYMFKYKIESNFNITINF